MQSCLQGRGIGFFSCLKSTEINVYRYCILHLLLQKFYVTIIFNQILGLRDSKYTSLFGCDTGKLKYPNKAYAHG